MQRHGSRRLYYLGEVCMKKVVRNSHMRQKYRNHPERGSGVWVRGRGRVTKPLPLILPRLIRVTFFFAKTVLLLPW